MKFKIYVNNKICLKKNQFYTMKVPNGDIFKYWYPGVTLYDGSSTVKIIFENETNQKIDNTIVLI